MKRSLPGVALVLGVLLLSALAWSELYLHSRNSLLLNGNWISSKQRMQLHLVGAVDFLEARQALAGNQLDLGTWSGFNEVLLNRVVTPLGVRLRFRVAENAHLSILFARDSRGYAGFRVSRVSELASGFFRATPGGRFSDFAPVDFDAGEDWHLLELELDTDAASVRIGGRELARFAGNFAQPQTLGFRSGLESAEVDDVEVVLRSGEVIAEDFRRSEGRLRALFAFTIAIALLSGVLACGVRVVGGPARPRAPLFAFVLTAALAGMVGTALLIFDTVYWSSNYFYRTPGLRLATARGIPLAVEELRHDLLQEGLAAWIGDKGRLRLLPEPFVEDAIVRRGRPPRGPDEEYSFFSWRDPKSAHFVPFDRVSELPKKAPGTFRVVFIGSSQTWGAGAESPDDTFVARTHQRLVTLLPSLHLETVNLAINGSNTYSHLPLYMQISEFVKPDLVIVNFGNNDRNPHDFGEHLHGFVEWNASLGADTILLREANSIEHPSPIGLHTKHKQIDAVGQAQGVPVLDLHGYLNSTEVVDSGFLWWDYVHFTSYGHRLVADWLAPQVAAVIRERIRNSGS